jgi:WD40 repeat protein
MRIVKTVNGSSVKYIYLQVILESGTQFKDSVVHVQFSNDGMYLAAADLSGVIKVWKLNGDITPNREIIWEFETSDISVS